MGSCNLIAALAQHAQAHDGEAFVDIPWRQLIETVPAAIYTTDAAGRLTFYNDASAVLWGCRPELGRSEFSASWKLYWPDGTPMSHDQCAMALALKEQRPVRGMQAVAERPDGVRVPFIPFPTPLFDASGALAGAINLLVDITECDRVDAALRESQQRSASDLAATQRLQKISSQLTGEDRVETLYQQILEAAVAIMGSDKGSFQIIGGSRNDPQMIFWHGFDRQLGKIFDPKGPDTSCAVARRLGHRVIVPDVERCDFIVGTPALQDYCKTGIRAVQSTPLVSRAGRVLGMISTHWREPHHPSERDLSLLDGLARQAADLIECKQTEYAAQQLAAIVASSQDAIISENLDGTILSWNAAAERLFGYTAEEAIGQPVAMLIPDDRPNEELNIFSRIRRGEQIKHYETKRRRKDGSLVDISLTVSPVTNASGKVVGASKIARDITERKQAQKRQDLLAREIHHRTKNVFSVVQAVVSRSFAGKATLKEAEQCVLSRLHSLAHTHVMLMEKDWQGGDIAELVRFETSPYGDRVAVQGPSLMLNAQAAQNFALSVHELATNAAKYGALSNLTGRVRISWCVFKPNGHHQFRFLWRETHGPRVKPPRNKGFGTTVLELLMAEYFETPPRMDFAPDGVRYEVVGSLEAITAQGQARP